MEKLISVCEICGKIAENELQKRKENWIEFFGGLNQGIFIWLDKPRIRNKDIANSYTHRVGWKPRTYHFCSITCLTTALIQNESI